MRLAVVALALVAAWPAGAESGAITYEEVAMVPCRVFLSTIGTALYVDERQAILNYLDASPYRHKLGSACNVDDYVEAACKAHRNGTIGQAIDGLIATARADRPLPQIRMCGA